MKQFLVCFVIVAAVPLSACTSTPTPPAPQAQLRTATIDNAAIVAGQTVYIPVYSHIYSLDRTQQMDLTATWSVRNGAAR